MYGIIEKLRRDHHVCRTVVIDSSKAQGVINKVTRENPEFRWLR